MKLCRNWLAAIGDAPLVGLRDANQTLMVCLGIDVGRDLSCELINLPSLLAVNGKAVRR